MAKSRLRIAVWYSTRSGGSKRALHDQLKGLVARGHEVELWCPPTLERDYLPLDRFGPEHVVPFEVPPVPARGRLDGILRPVRWASSVAAATDRHARLCAEQIRAGRFDLLYATLCINRVAPPIGRHVDLPSAFYLQEPNRGLFEASFAIEPSLPHWLSYRSSPSWERRSLGQKVYDLSCSECRRILVRNETENARAYDAVLCNSLYSRECIMRAYGVEAEVCYLGIDTEAFRPSGAPKEPFVVGLGSIHPHKGVDRAIDALATIPEDRRPPLVWIGNYGHPGYVGEMADRARGLGVRFETRELVPHAELVDLLGRAAAMLFTSRLEPFGLAPLEANACGTAAVGVAEGGVRETIRDGVNGTLVAAGGPAALGRAVARYADDLEEAARVGRSARRYVEEHWSLGGAVDRIEAALISVADGRRASSPRPAAAEAGGGADPAPGSWEGQSPAARPLARID